MMYTCVLSCDSGMFANRPDFEYRFETGSRSAGAASTVHDVVEVNVDQGFDAEALAMGSGVSGDEDESPGPGVSGDEDEGE